MVGAHGWALPNACLLTVLLGSEARWGGVGGMEAGVSECQTGRSPHLWRPDALLREGLSPVESEISEHMAGQ